jgi:integrase
MRLDKQAVARLTREAAAPGAAPDAIFFDEDLSGFGLRLRRSGGGLRRSYVVQYRAKGGRSRRMKIGTVEKISPDEARKAAKKLLARVELGDDPQSEKMAARAKAENTMRWIVEQYLETKKAVLRPASFKVTRLYLTGPYFKPLHNLPATDIGLSDVAGCLSKIAKTSGTMTASRARAALSAMFTWSMGEGLLGPKPVNPVVGTNNPQTIAPRDRVLSDAELAAIWNASGNDDFGRIVKLLVLTGCRREEIGGMRWSEIDMERRVLALPAERVKNKHAHALPLCDAAIEIIGGIPRMLHNDTVFSRRGGATFSAWSLAKVALDARLGDKVAEWRLHDLRRSCATRMADIGIQPHIIEEALNHRSGHRRGVAGIYNRSNYEPEVRTALTLWSSYVQAIVGGAERSPPARPSRSSKLVAFRER